MELEHRHQLELKENEMKNAIGGQLLSSMMDVAMRTPEAKQVMGQAIKNSKKR